MFRNPYADGLILLLIVLLFFGPKRLPGLGRSLGQGLREFKDSITGSSDEDAAERPSIEATPATPAHGESPPTPPVESRQAGGSVPRAGEPS